MFSLKMSEKIPCTVQILTLNSGKTLTKCLESLGDFDDILILDGGSSDNTVAVAKSYGARVFPQSDTQGVGEKIKNFSDVRNKGLSLAKYPWVLVIDSDEYISKELPAEIREVIKKGENNTHFIYMLPRKFVYRDEVIERSIGYPSYQHRFFYTPRTLGFYKPVHESIKPRQGGILGTLRYPEYVPLDPIEVVRTKTLHYLKIQQDALKNLSFKRLLKGLRSNISKVFKFLVKFMLISFKAGKRMPFAYEYETIMYHVRLTWRLVVNYKRKFL